MVSSYRNPIITILKPCNYSYRIIALTLRCFTVGVDTAIDACNNLSQQVFSVQKRRPGDRRFKATKPEEVIKSLVQDLTGDLEGHCWKSIIPQSAEGEFTIFFFNTFKSQIRVVRFGLDRQCNQHEYQY